MSPQTVRSLRRLAVVYLGLAATGVVIGWNRYALENIRPRVPLPG